MCVVSLIVASLNVMSRLDIWINETMVYIISLTEFQILYSFDCNTLGVRLLLFFFFFLFFSLPTAFCSHFTFSFGFDTLSSPSRVIPSTQLSKRNESGAQKMLILCMDIMLSVQTELFLRHELIHSNRALCCFLLLLLFFCHFFFPSKRIAEWILFFLLLLWVHLIKRYRLFTYSVYFHQNSGYAI